MTTLAAVLAAYLIGAVPIGFLVARTWGIGDIRRAGSGNIGASNVLRTAGWVPGFLTLGGDVAKGYLAVIAGRALGGTTVDVAAAAAVAAMAGNCWSPFLLLRGGKGVATGLGAFLNIAPLAALPAGAVWLAVTMASRYVSLGSMLGALALPLGALAFGYPAAAVWAGAGAAAIVILRHHENIARLVTGTERRLGERRA